MSTSDTELEPGPAAPRSPRPSSAPGRGAWTPVIWYGLVAAAVQMLWLTFAAITTDSARRYGVSVTTVGWLAEIFPLLYVMLAIPAGALLDTRFRAALGSAAVLMAVGAFVRAGGDSFAWALTGQVAIAVAQPVILSAVGKLAGEYLPEADRANGIAVGSAGNFVGMLIALGLGPALAAHGHLERLLLVEAVLAIIPAVGLAMSLRRPGQRLDERAAIGGSAAVALWSVPDMRTLCGLVFLGFGIFVAIATWLQTLLHPDGVSDTTAGILLVGMVVAGVVGCAVIAPVVSQRRVERRYMLLATGVTAAGCVICGVSGSLVVRGVALVVIGLLLLPALPIVMTAAERIAGRLAGTAGAIVWLAGNLGGLVVALIVQVLVHHVLPAFAALAGVALFAFPLVLRLPQRAVDVGDPLA
ncbi:MAG: MFS transporter [Solirubrobacterales bacterium]|nr:MFS transporter [Solirubrobacterales bacterium]